MTECHQQDTYKSIAINEKGIIKVRMVSLNKEIMNIMMMIALYCY